VVTLLKRMRAVLQSNPCIFLVGVLLVLLPLSAHAALITDVRFWSAPDHTRVVLDLTEPPQYETSSKGSPLQLQLELKDAALYTRKREVIVNDAFLEKILLAPLGKDRVELVLRQKKILDANIFPLKAELDRPDRLVIDLIDVAQEKKEQDERRKQKETRSKGTTIIVVDPGHGGEDPGAIGPRKTMEKDIVLSIGKKLTHFLNQNHATRAFLTRKGDYFVPLEERVRIAREYGADLFISLHTDGSFNPHARGTSVYCLSLSGATDEAAKILADKENMSNILGGAFLKPASLTRDRHLNQILLDLMQNNSMKESIRFAELVLPQMEKVNRLKYSSFRQANFIVLRAPDIPSTLVELAYITNKYDERLLTRTSFQEEIAEAVTKSAVHFFQK
jgi:N-acetylmuramoyl-L-alanine amidase